jgi:hypothetical protein
VGAGPLGLFRRKGNTDELEIFKDKVKAVSFSARENWLTMTCPDKVVFSADGVRFRSKGADFSQVTSHRDPRDP